MTTPTAEPRAIDPAGVFFGILVPVLAAAAGVVATYVLAPRLPEQIATHWSGSSPDGFATPTASAWAMAAIALLVGGGCSGIAALAQAQLMTRRVMLLLGTAALGVIVAAQFSMILGQVDLADPSDARMPADALVLGLVVGAVVGAFGASTLRDHRVRTPATEPPPARLPRGAAELPIVDQVGMSSSGLIVTGLALTAPTVLIGWWTGQWWLLGLWVPAVLLAVVLLQYRFVVDTDGIRVRNMGMSAMAYGTDEVEQAQVTEVRPFQDFGGWGLKTKSRGNYGLVTRTGPAVVITFACGHTLTVTTSRAAEIAGALNAMADRRTAAL